MSAATLTMESPSGFPDSPMDLDQDDVVYPCRGCGEILQEGKAYELAGQRWHVHCFHCNTCKTLLDSDANLLLLGDGSLICSNCTYSCSACHNKIEDLAILTGEQAFCRSCFKCRNCKRKIENLRYARTSQGIFCMSCHESLMARRRKRSKQNRNNSSSNGGHVVLDKSLPALPPSAVSQAFSPTPEEGDMLPDVYTDTPSEMSPLASQPRPKDASLNRSGKHHVSPPETDESRKENMTLPASTYADHRRSSAAAQMDGSGALTGGDEFFINLALDPSDAPGPSPMLKEQEYHGDPPKQSVDTDNRDYMSKGSRIASASSHRDVLKESGRESSRSSSTDRTRRVPQSPHIAYQQKGRQPSSDLPDSRARKDVAADPSPAAQERSLHSQSSSTYTSQASSTYTSQATSPEFKLQDAPKPRKNSVSRKPSKSNPATGGASRETSGVDARTQDVEMPRSPTLPQPSPQPVTSDNRPLDRPRRPSPAERTATGDSTGPGQHRRALPRKEVATTTDLSTPTPLPSQSRHERATSKDITPRSSHDTPNNNNHNNTAKTGISDVPSLPARSTSRPNPLATADSYPAPPRIPPPPLGGHKTSDSITSLRSNLSLQVSPMLPQHNTGDNFNMEDEFARILNANADQVDDRNPNVLQRVSNAARHMRSLSDRSGQTLKTNKFVTKNGSVDISSPTSATSAEAKDDPATLRSKLQRAQQKIADLEAEKHGLVRDANNELQQKRSTMASLDSQREIVIRELEIMTENLRKAKDPSQMLDLSSLRTDVIREFGASLENLKAKVSGEIEELVHKRNQLHQEISELIDMKDKGIQEYEALSSRNDGLKQMNGQLVHSIHGMYQENKGNLPPLRRSGSNGVSLGAAMGPQSAASSSITSLNGLGIYHTKDLSSVHFSHGAVRGTTSGDPSLQNLINEDAEPAVMQAPQVVNIRKGRANMWKKGAQVVGKNIKGIKGAFASANQYPDRNGGYGSQAQIVTEGMPYGSMTNAGADALPIISGPMNVRKGDGLQAPTWSMGGKGSSSKVTLGMGLSNASVVNVPDAEETLYGSDLSARCKFEGHIVPMIVTRCIEEVELRGMTVEGVYRKSGGSGQVNAVRMGFEKDGHFDISDPDLDIHAITSALKQYFRRLPTPLITYDVYDVLIDIVAVEGEGPGRVRSIKAAIGGLPKAHRDVLSFLAFHLARVMQSEHYNRMTSLNLAVVFAPTIMRPGDIQREMVDMQAQRIVVQTLLENNTAIFADD